MKRSHSISNNIMLSTINIISISEAIPLTGYSKTYLMRVLAEAGITRLGKSDNYLKDEFLAYFKFRSKVNAESKKAGENNLLKNERIRLNWRKELDL